MPSVRKIQALCSRKLSCVRTAQAIRREKLSSTVWTARAIRSKNCHLFERLQLSVPKYCQPLYCSKPLSTDPRRPSGSQSGQVKVQARCKGEREPLDTDSHQTISKQSSECWLPKLSSLFLPSQLTATKNFKSFSFRYNLVLYSFLIFFCLCITWIVA